MCQLSSAALKKKLTQTGELINNAGSGGRRAYYQGTATQYLLRPTHAGPFPLHPYMVDRDKQCQDLFYKGKNPS